ncbi:MAG: hypothetical protein Q4C47_02290, partial [Planctomycetia bacterium]|nr:hypothetical protein [Planctomycetia bacterium]
PFIGTPGVGMAFVDVETPFIGTPGVGTPLAESEETGAGKAGSEGRKPVGTHTSSGLETGVGTTTFS